MRDAFPLDYNDREFDGARTWVGGSAAWHEVVLIKQRQRNRGPSREQPVQFSLPKCSKTRLFAQSSERNRCIVYEL